MSASYVALAAEHASSPQFSPLVPRAALTPLAIILLIAAFILSFAFSTLRPSTAATTRKGQQHGGSTTLAREVALGGAASIAGGVGLVLAFCAIGANV
ncbi:hypothetical protein JCM8115_005513 [Rhodotorula mucilaginosa]|uniref:Dolichyl-diphosphooligosaccharide-protein glycosyltransferase subunit OST5 n=1 Tax=Rhodotorula mucilaginosa TaxID=5537 RepID=A0A9P7B7P9_RHOMI|nr:hypothetical protein C6P46_003185 [Rhodotorula mucilaginosa]TKA55789.1 hypothetical protein B0A53_02927 [Rhodotorula sp. CCFEE 5036]